MVTRCQHNPKAICRGTREDECHDPSLWAYLLNSAYLYVLVWGPGLKLQCWHTSAQLKCPWTWHHISQQQQQQQQQQAGHDLRPLWRLDKMFFYHWGTTCYISVVRTSTCWTGWLDFSHPGIRRHICVYAKMSIFFNFFKEVTHNSRAVWSDNASRWCQWIKMYV